MLDGIGFTRLASSAWAALPFSFVIDYVTNIDVQIREFENQLRGKDKTLTLEDPSISTGLIVSTKVTAVCEKQDRFASAPVGAGGLMSSFTSSFYTRTVVDSLADTNLMDGLSAQGLTLRQGGTVGELLLLRK
jgi:predicted Zn-dependent protease with MMP-like domain